VKIVHSITLMTMALAACQAQEQQAEPEEWIVLFDGESFTGWRGLGLDSVPAGHWIIEDGTSNFELVLEWKVSAGANSGIKYNVSEELSTGSPPMHAALGFEYQILDDALHPDAQSGPNRTAGALYDLVPPAPNKELRPVGAFNEARIVFNDGHGEHWLNGVKVIEFELASAAFDSAFAVSKYRPIDGFAEQRKGHIVLQDHGDDVWFRNIRIREITP
jgi:hypothetical protein